MATTRSATRDIHFTFLVLTIGAVFAFGAFLWLGWLGVMLVGLSGLWLTNHPRALRADREGDIVYADDPWNPVSKAVEERGREELKQRLASEGRSQKEITAERARLRYLKNTAMFAVTLLGFVMMMVHG